MLICTYLSFFTIYINYFYINGLMKAITRTGGGVGGGVGSGSGSGSGGSLVLSRGLGHGGTICVTDTVGESRFAGHNTVSKIYKFVFINSSKIAGTSSRPTTRKFIVKDKRPIETYTV